MRNLRQALAAAITAVALLVSAAPASPALAAGDGRSAAGTAYAVVTDAGELVFLRSEQALSEGEGQTVTDVAGHEWRGKVYTGVETAVYPDEISTPWGRDWREITSFKVADGCLVRPASCAFLLCDLPNMATADLSGLDTSGVSDFSDMFRFCSGLVSINLDGLDTSAATDMARMFYHCESLESIDLSGLDTSGVTDMEAMFSTCKSLEELDLTAFDTSNVRDMSGMFAVCSRLRRLDLSSFDTSAATDMLEAFDHCGALGEVSLGGRFAFAGAGIPVGSRALLWAPFDDPYDGTWCLGGDVTTAVDFTDLSRVYDGATMAGAWVWTVRGEHAISYDLGGGSDGGHAYPDSYVAGTATPLPGCEGSSIPAPTRGEDGFAGWADEDGLPISAIPASSHTDRTVTATWRRARSTEGQAYAVYNPTEKSLTLIRSNDAVTSGYYSTVTDICGRQWYGKVWGGVEELDATIGNDVPWYNPYSRTDILTFSVADGCRIVPRSCAWWLYCNHALESADLEGLDTSRATSFAHMFDNCRSLEAIDLSPLDTSSATSTEYMFNVCSSLRSIDLSPLDTSKVANMRWMFNSCSSLTSLDLSPLDTGSATDMSSMLGGCRSLEEVVLTGIDTSRVTNMSYMFASDQSLREVPAADLDTRSVTNFNSMFAVCPALEELDLSGFDTGSAKEMTTMFSSCSSLRRLDISSFDTRGAERNYLMFRGCASLEEVVLGRHFTFDLGTPGNNDLPDAPADETHTGYWANAADDAQYFLAADLSAAYDGETMAGTWVWETYRSFPLALDLAGGSAPEGQEYPDAHELGRELPLPGTEGSALGAPTRHGHAFLGWLDEEGEPIEAIAADSRGARTIAASWEALQVRASVPVAATLTAAQAPDGTVTLTYGDGDYALGVTNQGDAPVAVSARAAAADGFEIAADPTGDCQADVWMTPVTTGDDPTAEGYDPTSDEGHEEHGQVRLSQMEDWTAMGPVLQPSQTLWLNGLGGRMGGWSTNDLGRAHLASIAWTVSLAPEE